MLPAWSCPFDTFWPEKKDLKIDFFPTLPLQVSLYVQIVKVFITYYYVYSLVYIILQHFRGLTISHETVNQVLCNISASVRPPAVPRLVSLQKPQDGGRAYLPPYTFQTIAFWLPQTSTRVHVIPTSIKTI